MAPSRGTTASVPSIMNIPVGARVLPGHYDPACIAVRTETPLEAVGGRTMIRSRVTLLRGLRYRAITPLAVVVGAGGACGVARPSSRARCLLSGRVLDEPESAALLPSYL